MQVSTDEVIYNEKRNSVKITTESAYDVGTVWVFDAVHMPVGCSQWPAFWTTSPDWPVGGEIDILEGVNLQTKGQYAVHTVEGCKLTAETSQLTGTIGATDCNATTNAGCTVFDSNTNSYGEGFNSNGGGVWVSELAEDAISIWFIARPDVPSSLTADAQSIDTSTLGTPTAYYPASGCNGPLSDYIHTQQAIIDITLCGVWAGTDATLSQYGCEVPAAPQTWCVALTLRSCRSRTRSRTDPLSCRHPFQLHDLRPQLDQLRERLLRDLLPQHLLDGLGRLVRQHQPDLDPQQEHQPLGHRYSDQRRRCQCVRVQPYERRARSRQQQLGRSGSPGRPRRLDPLLNPPSSHPLELFGPRSRTVNDYLLSQSFITSAVQKLIGRCVSLPALFPLQRYTTRLVYTSFSLTTLPLLGPYLA